MRLPSCSGTPTSAGSICSGLWFTIGLGTFAVTFPADLPAFTQTARVAHHRPDPASTITVFALARPAAHLALGHCQSSLIRRGKETSSAFGYLTATTWSTRDAIHRVIARRSLDKSSRVTPASPDRRAIDEQSRGDLLRPPPPWSARPRPQSANGRSPRASEISAGMQVATLDVSVPGVIRNTRTKR